MADAITATLVGVEDLLAAFKALPAYVEDKVMATAMSRAGARLRTLMRRRAPRGSTGQLKASIRLKKLRTHRGLLQYRVGLGRNYYYEVLDEGRKAFTRKGKPVAGTPHFNSVGTGIAEVWESNKRQVLEDIMKFAREDIAKEAGRIAVRIKAGRRY